MNSIKGINRKKKYTDIQHVPQNLDKPYVTAFGFNPPISLLIIIIIKRRR